MPVNGLFDCVDREIQDKYKLSLSRDAVQQFTVSAGDRRGLSPSIFVPVQRHVLRRLTDYWVPRYLLHREYLNQLRYVQVPVVSVVKIVVVANVQTLFVICPVAVAYSVRQIIQVLVDTNGPRDALRHTQSLSCCA